MTNVFENISDHCTGQGSGYCNDAKSDRLMEGNIGQAGDFPWLGVLRVHLHEEESLKVALTGLVLVRSKYALGNADDISKIPRSVFREDSKAMFIPKPDEPWFSRVEDYLTHPEYEYATRNTVAVLTLLLEEYDTVPFSPVCWPRYSFNASSHLYAIGYTDENKLLQKEIFKLQYINAVNCKEFYVRSGLTEPNTEPAHYQCGYAEKSKSDCVWENGIIMASNASGIWTLIGFGVRGPGCAAPARFIDAFSYMSWVLTATDLDHISDYRRSEIKKMNNTILAYVYNFKLMKKQLLYIDYLFIPYKFEIVDDTHENKLKACDAFKTLIYRDKSRIVTNGSYGHVTYRLTMYDMRVLGYSCVKIKVESKSDSSKSLLWWMTYIDKDEGSYIPDMEKTPEYLLKNFTVFQREPNENSSIWKPGKHLAPTFLKNDRGYSNIENINLLVKFNFSRETVLHVSVYAPLLNMFDFTTQKPESNTTKTSTNNSKAGRSFHHNSMTNKPANLDDTVNPTKTKSNLRLNTA
ncbi:hypothetical protein ACJJTC_004237 [Scirpophaga incertulas]